MLAGCSSSAWLAVRRASHSVSSASTSCSSPAKASSNCRCVEASTSARSSCWPWISTSAAPTAFRVCTLIDWSLMKARVRPSASCTRRRIISPVSSRPFSDRIFAAGWSLGTSKVAVTWPCSAPWRTRPESPRPPSASAKASSRMDLPPPACPVGTARPRENSISSRSSRPMSRIHRRASMRSKFLTATYIGQGTETHLLPGPANIGTLVLARLETAGLYKIIGVLVPLAVRKVVAKHGRRRLCLADDADRHIGLGEAVERFLDMARGLVARDHGLETVDRRSEVALIQIIAADIQFLAGELVARAFELGLGGGRIFGGRVFANHLFQRRDRLFGAVLVAGDVRDLVVMRGRDQILSVSGIRAAGMQRDVTGRGADAAVVVALVVEGIGRHQERFARPVRIGMLTVDFLEFLRRRLVILALVHQIQALIVELVRRVLVEGVVLGGKLVPQRAGAAPAQGNGEQNQARRQPQRPSGPG